MKNCEKKTLPVNWLSQRSDTVSVLPSSCSSQFAACLRSSESAHLSKFVRAASQNRATASPAYKVLYVLLVLP